MVINRLKILLIISVYSFLLYGQGENEISARKDELTGIRSEIKKLEDDLKLKTKEEKRSAAALENYNRQNYLLNKLINTLRKEESSKQREIENTSRSISKLEKEITVLKSNYARYVTSVYKRGRPDELSSFLDAESVQQGLRRIKYLRRFSESREKDLKKLKSSIEALSSARIKLQKEKEAKALLAEEKIKEEKLLSVKLDESRKLIAEIKSDKSEIANEISFKRKSEEKIKNLITKLVEEAERKKREEAERLARLEAERLKAEEEALRLNKTVKEKPITKTTTERKLPKSINTDNFSSFSTLKGNLIWPLAGGKIIRRFGENRNEKLKTVTMNYGVDIKAVGSLDVKAVAEGVVSAIEWIPGYGSVIILTHKGEYRTVYSHLAEIYVSEGEKVKMGTRIAKIGETLEGTILHFEIWNSRNNQDPETWLAKR